MLAGEPGPERLVCAPSSKSDLVSKGVLRQFDRVLAVAREAFVAPIAEGRRADYLAALRDADAAWAESAVVDVARLTDLLSELLIGQIEDSSSGSGS